MAFGTSLDNNQLQLVAGLSGSHITSVARTIRGEKIRPSVARRIREALEKVGLSEAQAAPKKGEAPSGE